VMVYDWTQADNNNRVKLYINWVSQAITVYLTTPTSVPKISWTARIWNIYVGWYLASNWNYELVEIYKAALSADEIALMYSNNQYKDVRNWLVLDIDWDTIDKFWHTIWTILNTKVKKQWPKDVLDFRLWYLWIPATPDLTFWDWVTDKPFSWVIRARLEINQNNRLMCKWNGTRCWAFATHMSNWLNLYFSQNNNINISIMWYNTSVLATCFNYWHCFWFTYDWSKTVAGIKLYYDWVPLAVSASVAWVYTGMWDINTEIQIGAISTAQTMVGRMDKARIYNRVLTAKEMTQIYTNSKALYWL